MPASACLRQYGSGMFCMAMRRHCSAQHRLLCFLRSASVHPKTHNRLHHAGVPQAHVMIETVSLLRLIAQSCSTDIRISQVRKCVLPKEKVSGIAEPVLSDSLHLDMMNADA